MPALSLCTMKICLFPLDICQQHMLSRCLWLSILSRPILMQAACFTSLCECTSPCFQQLLCSLVNVPWTAWSMCLDQLSACQVFEAKALNMWVMPAFHDYALKAHKFLEFSTPTWSRQQQLLLLVLGFGLPFGGLAYHWLSPKLCFEQFWHMPRAALNWPEVTVASLKPPCSLARQSWQTSLAVKSKLPLRCVWWCLLMDEIRVIFFAV